MPSSKPAAFSECPIPLDQGRQGTCVAYSVAQIVCGKIGLMYGVPMKVETLVTIIKAVCPCWNGSDVPKLCQQWNEKAQPVEDVDNGKAYQVTIDVKAVDFFEACQLATRFCGTATVSIKVKMSPESNVTHAISAFDYFPPQKQLVAVNSWGANRPYEYVEKGAFLGGWNLVPRITSVSVNGKAHQIPAETPLYKWKMSKVLTLPSSALLDFAKDKDEHQCLALLASGFTELHLADSSGSTALHYAAAHGMITVCKGIVSRFGESDTGRAWTQDENLRVPLMMALLPDSSSPGHSCKSPQHKGICRLLIKQLHDSVCDYKGKLLQIRDASGRTALHEAAKKGSDSLCKQLLDVDSSLVNIRDHVGRTALHEAAEKGSNTVCKQLLDLDSSLVNIIDHVGQSALHVAVGGNKMQTSLVLLRTGSFDTHSMNSLVDGRTVLHMVIRNFPKDQVKIRNQVCQTILDHNRFEGANLSDTADQTALHYASMFGDEDLLTYRLIAGHEKFTATDAKNSAGKTANDMWNDRHACGESEDSSESSSSSEEASDYGGRRR